MDLLNYDYNKFYFHYCIEILNSFLFAYFLSLSLFFYVYLFFCFLFFPSPLGKQFSKNIGFSITVYIQKNAPARERFFLFCLSFQSASELGKHRSCCYGSSDNSCYVRAHCLHQQIVGRVVLQAYNLGYTRCHRYGRYAGRSDERVDLVA